MVCISSLQNIALSWDVPFANCSSFNAHIMVLPNFYFVFLFSLFLSPLPHKWRFAVAPLHSFMEELVSAVIAEVCITLSILLLKTFWITLKTKCINLLPFHCDSSMIGVHANHESIIHFSIVARRDTFHTFLCLECPVTGQAYTKLTGIWTFSTSADF